MFCIIVTLFCFTISSLEATEDEVCVEYASAKTVSGVRYGNTKLDNEEIRQTLLKAAKTRKKKELDAQTKDPLTLNLKKTVQYTENGKLQKKSVDVYRLQNKEDKRRFRTIVQGLIDNKTDARTFVLYKNEPDLIQIKTGKGTYDVAVSPTQKKNDDSYVVKAPPPYGKPMCKSLQKILKIVEGTRSETARSLRHIATQDDHFIGSVKGGRARMQRYDKKAATRKDQEKIANGIRNLFISHSPKKGTVPKKHLENLLDTETDSPSSSS